MLDSYELYPTFELACDAIEVHIRRHIEEWNAEYPDEEDEFVPPDRKEIYNSFAGNYLHYYEAYSELLYMIAKMKVAPEKPKKYVYQYFVEKSNGEIATNSIKYNTFDEVCDYMDLELRERHEAVGKSWKPRMTHEEFKEYMGDYFATTYDFFDTDKYVLMRYDA